MPDKHEVGGSSPLGPTTKLKGFAKVKIRREPRAFLERAPFQKGRCSRSKEQEAKWERKSDRER